MRLRRWFLSAAAVALALGSSASGALPASAATQTTFKIGIDNAAPPGHDWLFVDFFPRRDVRVHRGDLLDFSWNTASIDGFHSVAFPKTGGSTEPFAVPDSDDGPSQIEANPLVFGPSDPTAGRHRLRAPSTAPAGSPRAHSRRRLVSSSSSSWMSRRVPSISIARFTQA